MILESIISAIGIPQKAWVDQRIPKKLLVDNGAPTATDKRQINDGIEEVRWLATLKPSTIGISAYSDNEREYLELAILSARFRSGAKSTRLTELLHRAIPYPILLIREDGGETALSLAHLRWSLGEAGQTVLESSPLITALDFDNLATSPFLASLCLTDSPRQDLRALYEGWGEAFEAYSAARITGQYQPATDTARAEQRRSALAEHETILREIVSLRAQAAKTKQLARRVELNLQIRALESRLAETMATF
jgi:hypothetical protein